MFQIAGYLLSYSDARAMMDRLQIPDKGVEDIRLKYPINDWLAKTKRYNIVCMTDGHMFNPGYKDAKGVLLITRIKGLRRCRSEDVETLVERVEDKHVKRWLVEEGGAKDDSLRWISFPDGEKLGLWSGRPEENNVQGPLFHYRATHKQLMKAQRAGQTVRQWATEAIARGEEVEIVWPSMEEPPDL